MFVPLPSLSTPHCDNYGLSAHYKGCPSSIPQLSLFRSRNLGRLLQSIVWHRHVRLRDTNCASFRAKLVVGLVEGKFRHHSVRQWFLNLMLEYLFSYIDVEVKFHLTLFICPGFTKFISDWLKWCIINYQIIPYSWHLNPRFLFDWVVESLLQKNEAACCRAGQTLLRSGKGKRASTAEGIKTQVDW